MPRRSVPPRRAPRRAAPLLLSAAVLLAGCADAALGPGGPAAPSGVASVAIAPGDLALEVGGTAPLTATLRDGRGSVLAGRAVAWTSTDTTVAAVSAGGVVRAVRAGSAAIRAASGGRVASVAVTVAERRVAWIVITPAGAPIPQEIGTARQLGVVARAADGTEVVGRPVAWTSSDPAVATVGAGGLLEAHAAGTTTVTAVVDGRRDSTTVWVRSLVDRIEVEAAELALAVGDARTLAAVARAEDGAALARTLAWSSSNAAVARVDAAGRVTATGAGSALLTVATEGRSATVRVTVTGELRRLTAVAGAPLPEILYATTTTVGGVAREARVQVTEGTLRLHDGRYELRLRGWLLVEGEAPAPATVGSDGVVAFDVVLGEPLLFEGEEDWWGRTPRFRGRLLPDGGLEVLWSREPGAPVVALAFVP